MRSQEEGGPPPWIPFGKKILKVVEQEKNFKALAEKDMVNKESTEFDAQRKDAIAEAAKQGSRKVFGGGNKQVIIIYRLSGLKLLDLLEIIIQFLFFNRCWITVFKKLWIKDLQLSKLKML